MKPFFLVITGPTAVGKTEFVDLLAQKSNIPIEIINGDMGQFYQALSIGTAKPAWQEAAYPHHLFDIVSEPIDFTVHDYRVLLLETMNQIWQRGALPVIVGGSGFYLKSVFFPPHAEALQLADGVDSADVTQENLREKWQELFGIDPERAKTVDPHDRYRVQRSLGLAKKTGKSAAEFLPSYEAPGSCMMIFLNRDRQELCERINQRVEAMLNNGWLQEIKGLTTNWIDFLKKKKLIGYPTLIAYKESDSPDILLDDFVEIVQAKTRQYAKRQVTFWTSFKKQLLQAADKQKDKNIAHESIEIEEVNLTFLDLALYINQLSEKLFTRCDDYV